MYLCVCVREVIVYVHKGQYDTMESAQFGVLRVLVWTWYLLTWSCLQKSHYHYP